MQMVVDLSHETTVVVAAVTTLTTNSTPVPNKDFNRPLQNDQVSDLGTK